ncbi:MAG: hypothetical protein IPH35_18130 [Rhodoferax sp.]|nr:hypothetical protein [Rhodoferax sp.]
MNANLRELQPRYATSDEILGSVQLSDKPEILRVDLMSPVGQAMHHDKVRAGFHAVKVSWPNSIRAIMYCDPGTKLPHPADVVAVYKRCVELREKETDTKNPLTAKRTQVALAASAAIDTVTILLTKPGYLATKQFSKSSSSSKIVMQGYNAGYLYSVLGPCGVNDIYDLSAVLKYCEQNPNALIIRGEPVSDAVVGPWVRRQGSDEGSAFKGNFKTPLQGRHYLEIDVDKLSLPIGWILDQASISKICEYIVHLLPPEFHEASYHWQLSSSAGVFDASKASAHFWFWLVQPVPDTSLKIWAKHVNKVAGIKLVDPALFQHVQPHYVAAPLFNGMADPFPVRSGLVTKSSDRVCLQLPPPEFSAHAGGTGSSTSFHTSGGSGFDYHLSQIGDHAGGDGFHVPVVRSAASYVSEHGIEGTDVEYLFSIIQKRVLAADASKHSKTDIDERASRKHIMSAIESGLRKYGDAASQRRKTRRLLGLTPNAHNGYQDITTIQSSIDAILSKVF